MASESFVDLYVKEIMGFQIGDNFIDGELGFSAYYQPTQESTISMDIKELLKNAGGKPKKEALTELNKSEKKRMGRPEYIFTFPNMDDFIVIIENKSNIKNHESKKYDQPSKNAVDGVLYYAKHLKEKYNVMAIAVSAKSDEEMQVSTFMWHKGSVGPEDKKINILMNVENYLDVFRGDYTIEYDEVQIRRIAQEFHNDLRDLGYSEKEKPLFISGILIALSDVSFRNTYKNISNSNDLSNLIANAISKYLREVNDYKRNKHNKMEIMINNYASIFSRDTLLENNVELKDMVKKIDSNIFHLIKSNNSQDVVGNFYNEFIRYSGGDGKGLGIVLTPSHITNLFCDIANVDRNTKLLDICCGTGAFLVSGLSRMFSDARVPADIERIRRENIYGVELNPELFTLAYSNMIVRQDGKSNLINANCFSKEVEEFKGKCNVGFINPPYSQKIPEIKFIDRMLDLLENRGIGIAIVPLSTAIGTKHKEERKQIMKKHKLLSVMTMPSELFYPVGAPTCIMVWEAHTPHDTLRDRTWFATWRDDGFVKRKVQGRIDYFNKWNDIKKEWIETYSKIEKKEYSIYKNVSYEDEWLAEAYLETDYSKLSEASFEQNIRDLYAYMIQTGDVYED